MEDDVATQNAKAAIARIFSDQRKEARKQKIRSTILGTIVVPTLLAVCALLFQPVIFASLVFALYAIGIYCYSRYMKTPEEANYLDCSPAGKKRQYLSMLRRS